MKNRKLWARFFLVFAILTAALIFYFSAQKAVDSSAISDGITLRVARLLRHRHRRHMTRQEEKSYLEMISVLVRKNAHFCEFALLGFNLMGFMRFRDPEMPRLNCRLWAWGIATVYAATDELHQLFINERAALFTDVLIDSAGGLAGTLALSLAMLLLSRLLRRRLT